MGAPISAILAETFIEHMEHKHIYPILKTHEIIAYYRYIDDIIIMYDQNKTKQTLNKYSKNLTTYNHP
jgi:hypothetical protein